MDPATPERKPPAIGVIGHTGRLGRALVHAVERQGWPLVYRRNRQGEVQDNSPAILFDCSSPLSTAETLATASRLNATLILAVSGRTPEQDALVQGAASHLPIVVATNLTQGHAIQALLATTLAAHAHGAECTVIDRHPKTKRDAPSATAKSLSTLSGAETIEVLRHGAPVADHTITLAWQHESVEIIHRVTSLEAAADGAIALIRRAMDLDIPGLYRLVDGRLKATGL